MNEIKIENLLDTDKTIAKKILQLITSSISTKEIEDAQEYIFN